MTIHLIFPNGGHVSGKTYRAVERELRRAQWTVFGSRRKFRREFARRAIVWAGPKAHVPTRGSSRSFLEALAKHRMCQLIKTNERGVV